MSGNCLHPVVDNHSSQFVNSFSAGPSEYSAIQSIGQSIPYMLEPGVGVSGGDFSLYSDQICNKRISYAGPEWSAGRPGHTPTRRILACGKLVEDAEWIPATYFSDQEALRDDIANNRIPEDN